jgi:hypothetical protein
MIQQALGTLSSFPRAELGDPPGDWVYKVDPSAHRPSSVNTSENLPINYDRRPISRSECQIINLQTHQTRFPSPDISSVSYSSNGKLLNSIIWLTGPSEGLNSNKTTRAHSSSTFVNDKPVSQAAYGIDIADAQKKTLKEIVSELIKNYKGNYTSFKLGINTSKTFAGNQLYQLGYNYTTNSRNQQGNNCIHCSEVDTLAIKDGRLYTIYYVADPKIFRNFLPFGNMIAFKYPQLVFKIFKIGIDALNANKSSPKGTLAYENSTYRVKMRYPFDWMINEHNVYTANSHYTRILSLFPKNYFNMEQPSSQIIIQVDNFLTQINLTGYVNEIISIKQKLRDFHLIESKLINNTYVNQSILSPKFSKADVVYNLILNHADLRAGKLVPVMPAYKLVYTYNDKGTTYKVQEIGMFIGADKVYQIRFVAKEKGEYDKVLPVAQKIIDSLDVNAYNFTYSIPKYGVAIQYPYSWTNVTQSSAPIGYNNNTHLAGVAFYSPIEEGPYYLYKVYRILIDYQSAYGEIRPYIITISQNADNRTWVQTVKELSLNGQVQTLNQTILKNFFVNGQSYIPFHLNLDSLNLPDQFYVYFSILDDFLVNGQECLLRDDTDFVAVPPPIYSMSLSPTSLKDLRPGDEKDIEVNIKSLSSLPFQAFLNSKKVEGLELTFKPNNLSGVPAGLTTADLHIKVLPNATAQPYTIPIHMGILLTPTVNLVVDNSTSATIKRDTNFTAIVSPPLSLSERISEAWNGFGPAVNGFVGVTAAIIGVGGVIGGWFLRRFKGKQSDNDGGDKYRTKQNEGW